MAKTNAELQKDLRTKRKANGWRHMWVPPGLVELVEKSVRTLNQLELFKRRERAKLSATAKNDSDSGNLA